VIGIDFSRWAGHLTEFQVIDLVCTQDHHASPSALLDEVRSMHSEAGGQDSIKGYGTAPSL
jgi:hypothetical protein